MSLLAGMEVVLTGEWTTLTKEAASNMLVSGGAIIKNAPGEDIAVIYGGETPSSEAEAAEHSGETVLSQAEMLTYLGGNPADMTALMEAKIEAAAGPAAPLASESAPVDIDELNAVIDELKSWAKQLKKRKDINIEVVAFRRKPRKALALRMENSCGQLAAFYSLLGGIHIEWNFKDGDGGGCLKVRAAPEYPTLSPDSAHGMNFGAGCGAIMVDEHTNEGNTWWVRDADGDEALVFACPAEGAGGVPMGSSLASYLRRGMEHGFCHYWPQLSDETSGELYDALQKYNHGH